MEKFENTYVKFDKKNKDHKSALRKIKNYNFVKDKIYEQLIPFTKAVPDLTTNNGTYFNKDEIYQYYSYMTENLGFNLGLMIGKFDCYLKESFNFIFDEELSKIWRKIMINAYGRSYKQELKEILETRRSKYIFDINAEINTQLSELDENDLLLD